MKNSILSLASLLLIAGITLSSCKKESDPEPQPPTITLQTGTDFVSGDKTVTVNSPLKFGIRANRNSTSQANLTGLTFTRTINGNTQTFDTTFSATTFNVNLTTVANATPGNETFTFVIRDAKGESASVKAVVTTIVTDGAGQAIKPGETSVTRKDHWSAL